MLDFIPNFLFWSAKVNLADFIKYQYLIQFALVLALLTSFPNKPRWVKDKIKTSVLFFFCYWGLRIVLSNAARQYEGDGGPELAGVFSNHILIVVLNTILIYHLGYRFVKIACILEYKNRKLATARNKRRSGNAF